MLRALETSADWWVSFDCEKVCWLIALFRFFFFLSCFFGGRGRVGEGRGGTLLCFTYGFGQHEYICKTLIFPSSLYSLCFGVCSKACIICLCLNAFLLSPYHNSTMYFVSVLLQLSSEYAYNLPLELLLPMYWLFYFIYFIVLRVLFLFLQAFFFFLTVFLRVLCLLQILYGSLNDTFTKLLWYQGLKLFLFLFCLERGERGWRGREMRGVTVQRSLKCISIQCHDCMGGASDFELKSKVDFRRL